MKEEEPEISSILTLYASTLKGLNLAKVSKSPLPGFAAVLFKFQSSNSMSKVPGVVLTIFKKLYSEISFTSATTGPVIP